MPCCPTPPAPPGLPPLHHLEGGNGFYHLGKGKHPLLVSRPLLVSEALPPGPRCCEEVVRSHKAIQGAAENPLPPPEWGLNSVRWSQVTQSRKTPIFLSDMIFLPGKQAPFVADSCSFVASAHPLPCRRRRGLDVMEEHLLKHG